jgi:hypothetical protein
MQGEGIREIKRIAILASALPKQSDLVARPGVVVSSRKEIVCEEDGACWLGWASGAIADGRQGIHETSACIMNLGTGAFGDVR